MSPMNPTPPPRSLRMFDAPLDTAQQSLADALRTSFKLLKLAIIVLVVLFLASGAFIVEQNEEALVLRWGEPVGGVHEAGAHWAFPYPIDRVLKLPVKQSSTMAVNSHWLHLKDSEVGQRLDQLMRSGGLDPTHDGALLTGDKGLVHIQWRLTYRIEDLESFVRTVSDDDLGKADELITKVLEKAAVRVAGEFTTEDATRKRLSDLRDAVRVAVNEDLRELASGIEVETVEIPVSTPPIQTRSAFDEVSRAENKKQTTIREAEQTARDRLNQLAGTAYPALIAVLDKIDAAEGDAARLEPLHKQLEQLIEFEASGRVGATMREAKGHYTAVVQKTRADLEQYQALLAEYKSQPELLRARLWHDARRMLFRSPEITKIYRPPGTEFVIRVGVDPKKRERQEREQILSKERKTQESHQHPIEHVPGGPLTDE